MIKVYEENLSCPYVSLTKSILEIVLPCEESHRIYAYNVEPICVDSRS